MIATVLVASSREPEPGTDSKRKTTMEYTRLGNTGLKVSRLALGCMSYGDPTTPRIHGRWRKTRRNPSFCRPSSSA
jgi:hypothetical protein